MAAAPQIMNATSAAENNPAVKGYARAAGETGTVSDGAGAVNAAESTGAGAAGETGTGAGTTVRRPVVLWLKNKREREDVFKVFYRKADFCDRDFADYRAGGAGFNESSAGGAVSEHCADGNSGYGDLSGGDGGSAGGHGSGAAGAGNQRRQEHDLHVFQHDVVGVSDTRRGV